MLRVLQASGRMMSQRKLPYRELDELTLRRAQRGEALACRELIHCYQVRVFAVVTRMVAGQRGRAVVEDIAQETFLRAFKNLGAFVMPGPARLSTWILTIATRLAIDELRRATLVAASEIPDIPDASSQTDAGHAQREFQQVLERALAGLPTDQRDVFVLHVIEEIPYEEIAKALNVELGTVKSRLSRAKAAVRVKLVEAGHER